MSGPFVITLEPLSNLNDHFKLHHVLRTFERTSKTVSHQKSNSKSHCLRTVPYALCGSEINSGSHIYRVCTSSCCGGLVGGWCGSLIQPRTKGHFCFADTVNTIIALWWQRTVMQRGWANMWSWLAATPSFSGERPEAERKSSHVSVIKGY